MKIITNSSLAKKITAASFAVLITLGSVISPVLAQGNIYRTLQAPLYDASPAIANCDTEGRLVGSENEERIFNFFVSKGLTPIQSAGIVGNIMHESGFEPQRLQNTPIERKTPAESLTPAQLDDRSLGWGIVQFTPPGKFIKNISPTNRANDLGVQLEFVWKQLLSEGPVAENPQILKDIRSATTLREAVLAFQGDTKVGGKYIGYERPYDQSGSVDSRTSAALNALNKYGSGSSANFEQNSSCTTDTSGEVVENFSLPVDKKWYTRYPHWFTKPHHTYPASDIPVAEGNKIYSITDGKITAITNDHRCGRGVFINAGDGIEIGYCHGTDAGAVPGAKMGDTVKAGQLIMHSGNTGASTGPHLHVQIKVGKTPVCPQSLFVGIATGKIPAINSLPANGCVG